MTELQQDKIKNTLRYILAMLNDESPDMTGLGRERIINNGLESLIRKLGETPKKFTDEEVISSLLLNIMNELHALPELIQVKLTNVSQIDIVRNAIEKAYRAGKESR
jgi:hypothetical protein